MGWRSTGRPVLAGYLIRSLRGATPTPKSQPDHSAQKPCVQGFCPRLRPQLSTTDELTSQDRLTKVGAPARHWCSNTARGW